jgi:hypothetical protein
LADIKLCGKHWREDFLRRVLVAKKRGLFRDRDGFTAKKNQKQYGA